MFPFVVSPPVKVVVKAQSFIRDKLSGFLSELVFLFSLGLPHVLSPVF